MHKRFHQQSISVELLFLSIFISFNLCANELENQNKIEANTNQRQSCEHSLSSIAVNTTHNPVVSATEQSPQELPQTRTLITDVSKHQESKPIDTNLSNQEKIESPTPTRNLLDGKKPASAITIAEIERGYQNAKKINSDATLTRSESEFLIQVVNRVGKEIWPLSYNPAKFLTDSLQDLIGKKPDFGFLKDQILLTFGLQTGVGTEALNPDLLLFKKPYLNFTKSHFKEGPNSDWNNFAAYISDLTIQSRLAENQRAVLKAEERELFTALVGVYIKQYAFFYNTKVYAANDAHRFFNEKIKRIMLFIKPEERWGKLAFFEKAQMEMVADLFYRFPQIFRDDAVFSYSFIHSAFREKNSRLLDEIIQKEFNDFLLLKLIHELYKFPKIRDAGLVQTKKIADGLLYRLEKHEKENKAVKNSDLENILFGEENQYWLNQSNIKERVLRLIKEHYKFTNEIDLGKSKIQSEAEDKAVLSNSSIQPISNKKTEISAVGARIIDYQARENLEVLIGKDLANKFFDFIFDEIKTKGLDQKDEILENLKSHGFSTPKAYAILFNPVVGAEIMGKPLFSNLQKVYFASYEKNLLDIASLKHLEDEILLALKLKNQNGDLIEDPKWLRPTLIGIFEDFKNSDDTFFYPHLAERLNEELRLPKRFSQHFLNRKISFDVINKHFLGKRGFWDPSTELIESVGEHPLARKTAGTLKELATLFPTAEPGIWADLFQSIFKYPDYLTIKQKIETVLSEYEHKDWETFWQLTSSRSEDSFKRTLAEALNEVANLHKKIHSEVHTDSGTIQIKTRISVLEKSIDPETLSIAKNEFFQLGVLKGNPHNYVYERFLSLALNIQNEPVTWVRLKRFLLNLRIPPLKTNQILNKITNSLARSAHIKSYPFDNQIDSNLKQIMLIGYNPPKNFKVDRLKAEQDITIQNLRELISKFDNMPEKAPYSMVFSEFIDLGFGRDEVALIVRLGLLDSAIKRNGKELKLSESFPKLKKTDELVRYSILSLMGAKYAMPIDFRWYDFYHRLLHIRTIQKANYGRISQILKQQGLTDELIEKMIKDGVFDILKISHQLFYTSNKENRESNIEKTEFLKTIRELKAHPYFSLIDYKELEKAFFEGGEEY